MIEASNPDMRIRHACSADCVRRQEWVCASFRRVGTEPQRHRRHGAPSRRWRCGAASRPASSPTARASSALETGALKEKRAGLRAIHLVRDGTRDRKPPLGRPRGTDWSGPSRASRPHACSIVVRPVEPTGYKVHKGEPALMKPKRGPIPPTPRTFARRQTRNCPAPRIRGTFQPAAKRLLDNPRAIFGRRLPRQA